MNGFCRLLVDVICFSSMFIMTCAFYLFQYISIVNLEEPVLAEGRIMARIVDTVQGHIEAIDAAEIEEECLSEIINNNDVMVCSNLHAALYREVVREPAANPSAGQGGGTHATCVILHCMHLDSCHSR
jgi:hypothetical protein